MRGLSRAGGRESKVERTTACRMDARADCVCKAQCNVVPFNMHSVSHGHGGPLLNQMSRRAEM